MIFGSWNSINCCAMLSIFGVLYFFFYNFCQPLLLQQIPAGYSGTCILAFDIGFQPKEIKCEWFIKYSLVSGQAIIYLWGAIGEVWIFTYILENLKIISMVAIPSSIIRRNDSNKYDRNLSKASLDGENASYPHHIWSNSFTFLFPCFVIGYCAVR